MRSMRTERHARSCCRGPYPGMGTGDPDLYKAFCLAVLAPRPGRRRDRSRAAALSARRQQAARRGGEAVLDAGAFEDVTMLLNTRGWVFDDVRAAVHDRACRRSGRATATPATSRCAGRSRARSLTFRDGRQTAGRQFPAAELRELDPRARRSRCFRARARSRSSASCARTRGFDTEDMAWSARPVQGDLNATNDKKHFDLRSRPRRRRLLARLQGRVVQPLGARHRRLLRVGRPEHITTVLQEKRTSRAAAAAVSLREFARDVDSTIPTLPCRHPRIAFRDDRQSDGHADGDRGAGSARGRDHQHRRRISVAARDAADEAFLLGVLCSIPLDWYARRVVEIHVNFHLFNAFPFRGPEPRRSAAATVEEIAGRLAAVDDRYADWAAAVGCASRRRSPTTERQTLIAELDAAVALLYGLDEDDVTGDLRDLPRGLGLHAAPRRACSSTCTTVGARRSDEPSKPTFATNRARASGSPTASTATSSGSRETWKKPFEVAIATAYFNPGGFALARRRARAAQVGSPPARRRARQPSAGCAGLTEPRPRPSADAQLRDALEGHDRDAGARTATCLASRSRPTRARAAARRLAALRARSRCAASRTASCMARRSSSRPTTRASSPGRRTSPTPGSRRTVELNLGHYEPHGRRARSASGSTSCGTLLEPVRPRCALRGALRAAHPVPDLPADAATSATAPRSRRWRGHDQCGLHLTPFQRDGVWRGRMILGRTHGVRRRRRGRARQDVHRRRADPRGGRGAAPAGAGRRAGGAARRAVAQVPRATSTSASSCVSFEELTMDEQLNRGHRHAKPVLHSTGRRVRDGRRRRGARVPQSRRRSGRRRSAGSSRARRRRTLVLLTATPVNNCLWDLYYLLALLRAERRSVRRRRASRRCASTSQQAMALDPDDPRPEHLFDVLDAVAVRRTRSFVKHYYPDAERSRSTASSSRSRSRSREVQGRHLRPRRTVLPGSSTASPHALDVPDDGRRDQRRPVASDRRGWRRVLTLARYAPSRVPARTASSRPTRCSSPACSGPGC